MYGLEAVPAIYASDGTITQLTNKNENTARQLIRLFKQWKHLDVDETLDCVKASVLKTPVLNLHRCAYNKYRCYSTKLNKCL